jgi:small GTP-binding protein
MISKRISSGYFDSNKINYDFFEICVTEKLLEDNDTIDCLLFDCQCALFLIDITDKESFEKIKQLSEEVNFSNYPYLKVILLENKIDMETKREIDSEEINNFITEKQIQDKIQISIKEGNGIEELVEKINKYTSNEANDIPINYISQDKFGNANVNKDTEINLSFILIGNSNVGKTCFFTRFQNNQFQENFLSTIGTDKNIKYCKYKDKECKVTLWDTAGQDRYKSLTKKYYQNANGVFIFYDVTEKESFNDISIWLDDVNDNLGKEQNYNENEKNRITIYLIGNKVDKQKRVITKEEAEEKASFYGIKYYEMSCKINLNITEIITRMIDDSISKIEAKNEKQKIEEKNINNGNFSIDYHNHNNNNKFKQKNKKNCC